MVTSASLTTIKCTLARRNASAVLPRLQPGSRGVEQRIYEGWRNVLDTALQWANEEEYMYTQTGQQFDLGFNAVGMSGRQEKDASDWRYYSWQKAFLRVPKTGVYNFHISSDDYSAVRTLHSALGRGMFLSVAFAVWERAC